MAPLPTDGLSAAIDRWRTGFVATSDAERSRRGTKSSDEERERTPERDGEKKDGAALVSTGSPVFKAIRRGGRTNGTGKSRRRYSPTRTKSL